MNNARPTPETDALVITYRPNWIEWMDFARKLERERDELREALLSEKSTRNTIIEKGVVLEKERDELREALSGRTTGMHEFLNAP